MTERELYKIIQPLLEGYTEGLFWDFKENLSDTAEIIKDILAFSNSAYDGDSYIIVGVSEDESQRDKRKLKLSTADRTRLGTDANFLYLPSKWSLRGLTATDINDKMKSFSKELTEKLEASMLISQPQCEFIPLQIKSKLWLFVIIVKQVPGVFISKDGIENKHGREVVKKGVLYVRIADITIGNDSSKPTPAAEHIRVWKRYIDWLNGNSPTGQVNNGGSKDDEIR